MWVKASSPAGLAPGLTASAWPTAGVTPDGLHMACGWPAYGLWMACVRPVDGLGNALAWPGRVRGHSLRALLLRL